MGKKANKKKARPPQKEKRVAGHSPNIVPEQANLNVEIVDGVTAVKERKLCSHFDKGFDANNLSDKIRSLDSLRCEDCREGVGDRKGAKGRGKQAKKKGSGSVDSKSQSKAVWVCLECGHLACGGVGLPTTAQSHAIRHSKQNRHPLVFQWENPQLQWCFPCNTLIPVEKTEGNGEKKDSVFEVVKAIKAQSFEQSSVDAVDVWIGRGSILSELNAEGTEATSLEGRSGHVVRGLVNLGNTCFFNSVMQNLLSMNKLRDYLNEEASLGPLSIALKKLFTDLQAEASLRNVINPKSFFGSVCSKAPQFRGYQQQDSHELLCCLLDGLSTEELIVRKRRNASNEDGIPPKHGPTFVDSAFGGRISSTVCCVECGHSSTMHEPFQDLSLPVPMKKPPIKKVQPVSRAKKTKLPPKRVGKVQPKVNKNMDSVPAQNISNPSVHGDSSCHTQSSSDNTLAPDSTVPSTVVNETSIASQNSMAGIESDSKQAVETTMEQTASSFEDFWMDYVGPETASDEHGLTSENNDLAAGQKCGDKFDIPNDGLMETCQASSIDGEPNQKPESSSVNPWEEEVPFQVQSSEVLLLPYREEGFTDGEIMEGEAEASSSFVGCEQDEAEFDGIGDLFNEPEVSAAPVAGPSLPNEVAGPVFIAGIGSESDPDEVDDTDSPVSIESCLSHFVKPELLSNDNAWECENCSKILQQQRLDAKKKQAKISPKTLLNGGETQIQSDSVSLYKDISYASEVRNFQNGDGIPNSLLNSTPEVFDSGNDSSNKNFIQAEIVQTEMEPFISQSEERKYEMNVSHSSGYYESCNGETLSGPPVDSCSGDETSGTGYTMVKDEQTGSNFSGNCESDVNEDEDKTSKKLNVKRDATRRFLIEKPPPILTIHLKRFSQDARGRLCKLSGHVTFRDVLDLEPYMDPRSVDTERYVYRLLGVVEHLGTMRGGHYIAYVRGDERNKGKADKEQGGSVWYYASDAHVREVSLEEVLRCDAYLLFYEKVSN
ncbi:PREDICTED: ubiquitin carboxyl-terminal hydrolase 2-like isoform X2 [Populus euphratica]|uniref:Ubiquitin carboxyl-terminal hydrolase n=1 Tax=Populus euphratica TaxID=75702 RepID=A0AAJ6V6J5_POPEU|nr:PREDICTED: ubiquitin carboxyl-terminal hydrolase 2-like isoform X2 [Populus euphratica]